MGKIIFATGNAHKMVEIRMILADLGMEILSQKEAGIQADVVEDGSTFEENAMIKATEIAKIVRQMPEYADAIVMADDSGLEIDYLNKEPGIYSARYMGEDTSYDIKNQTLLDRLDGVEDAKRTARFVCAIAAAFPDGSTEAVRGTMKALSDTRLQERTDLVMIQSFIYRNMDVPVQNLRRKRKMNLVIVVKDFGKCVRSLKHVMRLSRLSNRRDRLYI